MATILDIGLLKGFSDIFVWLLIFVVVYGGLEVSNLLKNKGLHALIAFAVTAVVVISGGGVNIVTSMTPWLVVIAFMVFFLFALGQFAGLDAKTILDALGGTGGKGFTWYIIIPLLIILIASWSQGSSNKTVVNEAGETVTVENPPSGFMEVLVNPKVLGLIAIMLIATFTLLLMGSGGPIVGGGH